MIIYLKVTDFTLFQHFFDTISSLYREKLKYNNFEQTEKGQLYIQNSQIGTKTECNLDQ